MIKASIYHSNRSDGWSDRRPELSIPDIHGAQRGLRIDPPRNGCQRKISPLGPIDARQRLRKSVMATNLGSTDGP